MAEKIDTRYTQERELSWLKFDLRVLEEAADESVPLFERLKFAAIFTSNLDEFFMIRVGSITDMTLSKQTHVDNKSGLTPAQQLDAICQVMPDLYRRRDKTVKELEKQLRARGICRLSMDELSEGEREQTERWFRDYVQPVLSPIVIGSHTPFPHLPSKSLNIILSLRREGEHCFGVLPVPKSLPPFLVLEGPGLRYVLTEQIMMGYAARLFSAYKVEEQRIVSVTRNADISPEDEDYDVGEDFRDHMQKVLKRRARLAPVRLEFQGEPSKELRRYLCQRLELADAYVFCSKAPLSMGYVYGLESRLPPESAGELCYPPYTPQWPSSLVRGAPLIPQILRRDVLLFYPYHTMDPFLKLIREAAADPLVVSIKITIYRLASTAKLAEYLAAAAENGKDVTVLMELRARFDEQNNIRWAQRLEEAGCTVFYGFERYKVHSKLCLITRQEKGHIQYITQVGTGNYNEKTAKLYTDFCFLTASPAIGSDAAAVFRNLSTSDLKAEYQYLLVSPNSLKDRLIHMIDGEIQKARQGKKAGIFLKTNSVTDRELIDKLAEASQAGVPVTMNVRGICCLRPGVPGLTDHIKVFSVVGRYLEHARIYAFGVGEDTKLYIGSADLMTRNTERRVEVACPIWDPAVRRQIRHYISLYCADDEKARLLQSDGSYLPVPQPDGKPALSVQTALMEEAVKEGRTAAIHQKALTPEPEKAPGLLRRLLGRFRKER